MATLTTVSNASMNEDTSFIYSFNTLKLRANESSDITAFKITSIGNDGALTAGNGAFVFTYSSGSFSINGSAVLS